MFFISSINLRYFKIKFKYLYILCVYKIFYEGDYMYLKKLKKLTLFSLIITMFFSIPIYNTYADEKNNVESNSKVVYLTFDDGDII